MTANYPYILMIGCFDTKGEVFSFLRDCLLAHGEKVVTINTGVLGTTGCFQVDVEANLVALEGGHSLSSLQEKGDRGYAVEVMGHGAAKIVQKLVAKGGVKGAIGMGGGGGTFITLAAMQQIPIGIPKLCMSTLAVKDLSRQIGSKDITLMPSVVDVAGLNSISQPLISQAAAAICAMANVSNRKADARFGRIAISMFGNTTACVDHCSLLLKEQGYEVFAFHANGIGGQTMEALIREGCFDAVLDITTTELADDLCGGICSAGPDRLNAAVEAGIPQVVVPGCLDMVNFAQMDTLPDKYRSREFYSWAPDVTLMRTNEKENIQLGKKIADKLNPSAMAVKVLLPSKGLSQIDAVGEVFYRPDINRVLFDTIKAHVKVPVEVMEVDAHINDQEFSETAVKSLLEVLESYHKDQKDLY